MQNTAIYSKETYLRLLHDLQMLSAVRLVAFCIKHDLEPTSIPVPSVIYISKVDAEDQLTPLAYLDVDTDDPKIVCMRFHGDEPKYDCFGFFEFLDNFTRLTKENHSKLSIVPQSSGFKS